jgi:cold shock CspA family protein/ribosome-associated translation inhibitor RaiA
MDSSAAFENRIRAHVQRLEKVSPRLIHCHVTIAAPHKHGHQGNLYEVHIQVTTPGGGATANREHRHHHSHENAYVALRDAFCAVRRQLQAQKQEQRQDVKHHEPEPFGWVSELYPAEDFGRIATNDGRSLYFHRNSLVGTDFDRLTTGTGVRFTEESGDQGPQASTVRLVAHSGPVG